MLLKLEPLEYLHDEARRFDVQAVCRKFLDDPRLPLWTGSLNNKHHYGKGGLLQHIAEVCQLCLLNNVATRAADGKKVFLAAFFHDVGKLWDYEPVSGLREIGGQLVMTDYIAWRATSHKGLLHHISRSAFEWRLCAQEAGFSEADIDEVTHAILAHHGLQEWGSPVTPKTKLAWLLHLCDSLSARLDDGGHK